jgi:hypothetical protein
MGDIYGESGNERPRRVVGLGGGCEFSGNSGSSGSSGSSGRVLGLGLGEGGVWIMGNGRRG